MTTAITKDSASNPPVTAASSQLREQAPSAIAAAAPEKPKRTLGLKIFDNFLYTFLSNTTVFAISVWFTYLTKFGNEVGKSGSKMRGFGSWFKERSDPVKKFISSLGFSKTSTDNLTMVGFSFLDGTLFAPLVKLFEDRREKIAYGIDTVLGTKPKDESVYIAEPKQTWGSVIMGRILTLSIVLPTALVLNKELKNGNSLFGVKPGSNINAKFLEEPGRRFGEKVVETMPAFKATLNKLFGADLKIPKLFEIVRFEAFYTSVCTAGLYVISRALAKRHPTEEQKHLKNPSLKSVDVVQEPEQPQGKSQKSQQTSQPTSIISSVNLQDRLAAPAKTAELTA